MLCDWCRLMHCHLPVSDVLFLHSGCNVGRGGDVTIFLGLSGELGHQTTSCLFALAAVVAATVGVCFWPGRGTNEVCQDMRGIGTAAHGCKTTRSRSEGFETKGFSLSSDR
jgi:hypothetical protein